MKRFYVAALSAGLAVAGLGTLKANEPKSPEEAQKMVQEKVEKMKSELNLTPDQETEIRNLMQNAMEQKRQVMEQTRQQMRAVLDPAQQQKLDEMMSKKGW